MMEPGPVTFIFRLIFSTNICSLIRIFKVLFTCKGNNCYDLFCKVFLTSFSKVLPATEPLRNCKNLVGVKTIFL